MLSIIRAWRRRIHAKMDEILVTQKQLVGELKSLLTEAGYNVGDMSTEIFCNKVLMLGAVYRTLIQLEPNADEKRLIVLWRRAEIIVFGELGNTMPS